MKVINKNIVFWASTNVYATEPIFGEVKAKLTFCFDANIQYYPEEKTTHIFGVANEQKIPSTIYKNIESMFDFLVRNNCHNHLKLISVDFILDDKSKSYNEFKNDSEFHDDMIYYVSLSVNDIIYNKVKPNKDMIESCNKIYEVVRITLATELEKFVYENRPNNLQRCEI